jgi:hypothetical protein
MAGWFDRLRKQERVMFRTIAACHAHGALLGPLVVALALLTQSPEAIAAPARQKAKAAAPAPRSKGRPVAPAATRPKAPAERPTAASTPAPPVVAPPVATPVVAGAKPTPEVAEVTKTEEARAGEKTYTFGAQEVEGRLKSPQILYFQRRVRAQFDAVPLGHRSFLLELSDTRRHPALE